MKTKLILYSLVTLLWGLSACNEEEVIPPHEDITSLNDRFHGKYEIVSSTSSEALDVDRDGQASTDLLQEIWNLAETDLIIHIPAPGYATKPYNFILVQFWQEQYFSSYSTDSIANYATQGVHRVFTFSPSLDKIIVIPEQLELDPLHFPLPDEVTIESNDIIKIVLQKSLYTSAGWKSVEVTTLYRRYTKTT